jgi:hypothetical protein
MSAGSKARPRASVGWRGRVRSRYAHGDSERGAVLVEAAFVFPVFLLLLFGMIEFGFIFKDSLTLSSMVQTGARTGAVEGNATDPSADYAILSTMVSGASALQSTIQSVIIFDATDASGNPLTGSALNSVVSACLAAGSPGIGGQCNVYDATEWDALVSNASAQLPNFCGTGSNVNGGSCWDQDWSPGSRNVETSSNNGAGPDYLGVYISAHHQTLTGFFPSQTLHEMDIVRLEPQSFS